MRSWLGLIYTGKHARISRSCMISSRYKGYTVTEWPLIKLIQCWSYGQLNNLRKGRRIVFQSWGAMEHWKVLWATMVVRQEKNLNFRHSSHSRALTFEMCSHCTLKFDTYTLILIQQINNEKFEDSEKFQNNVINVIKQILSNCVIIFFICAFLPNKIYLISLY